MLVLLFYYVVLVFVVSNMFTYYKLSNAQGSWVAGALIGHTLQAVAHGVFLFNVYPLLK